jgi:galactonate dehydratase
MPDAKHCGGLLEMSRIAAIAEVDDVVVSPHNPSGPVATAATVQLCAGLSNFGILELQWGEVSWRGELLSPPEKFVAGRIAVPSQPGFGFRFNEALARRHSL